VKVESEECPYGQKNCLGGAACTCALPDDELIELARFRRIDARNGSNDAKDRLLGLLADKIEALQAAHSSDYAAPCSRADLRRKYRRAVWALYDIKALAGTTNRKQAGCEIAAHTLAQLGEPLIANDEVERDG
jgi:phosphatidylethanolamine-binding protein (PEBP) family uncharacterized protein